MDEPRLTDPAGAIPGWLPPSPPPPVPVSEAELLERHRGWQIASILMIVTGIALPLAVIATTRGILWVEATPEAVQRLMGPLALLALGGMLLIAGLIANAVRAVVVRRALPPERYRGPAVGVLLLLTVILGTLVTLIAGDAAVALLEDRDMPAFGTLVLLTATQVSLLVIGFAFVAAPRALSGVRLLPESGLGRSIAIGLGLAIPAWLVATGVAYAWTVALEAIGLEQAAAITDVVLERGNPAIVLVAFVLVAPMAEELFFRGLVYNAWLRERGPGVAVYGSAALFAVIHGSVFALLPIFVLGVLLARTYRSTGSLPAVIAMHAGFNAISVALTLLVL